MVKKISMVLLLSALLSINEFSVFPAHGALQAVQQSYGSLTENSLLPEKARKDLLPFLLPNDHPAKAELDAIFSSSRVSLDISTFTAAGFNVLATQPRSFIRVASHPLLPGYLVKVYLDDEVREKHRIPYWKWLTKRCEGAKKIAGVIKKKKIKLFKVAQKWIYPLPLANEVPATPQYAPKAILLLVENMELVPEAENLEAWRTKITQEHLNELYTITVMAGGGSYRPDNIAFSKDGKFAFIDTEYPGSVPDLNVITQFLSSEMQDYWNSLFNM